MTSERIVTDISNGLPSGGAGARLALVSIEELFPRAGGDDMYPALLTNGGPMPLDITLSAREDEWSSRAVTPRDACETLGCTPRELREAIEQAHPESKDWDWGFGREEES